jgi:hypothetical protein
MESVTFDPLLASASMRLKARGYTHTASWTADDEPDVSPYAEPGAEDGFVAAWVGADAYRWSNATGRLFGRKMPRSRSFALMFEGGGAYAFAYDDDLGTVLRISRTGKVTLRFSNSR